MLVVERMSWGLEGARFLMNFRNSRFSRGVGYKVGEDILDRIYKIDKMTTEELGDGYQ